ncbi:MAG: hypothetical protein ABL995_14195 [Bryobacteraceae bacterium]
MFRPPLASTNLRRGVLLVLGATIVFLHILGYLQPNLIVGSRLVNRVAIPVLLVAALLLPRSIAVPADAWKTDPTVKWVTLVFMALGTVEVLLYAALMFNVLARFGPDYVPIDSNPTFQMLESRLGHLLVFSILGMMLSPVIVVGIRTK